MSEYNIKKLNILVIERHHLIRSMYRGIFHEFGIDNYIETDDLETGFRLLQDEEIDLIILDWGPGFNGIKFLHKIRKSPESPNPYVPVIMVTAHTERRHVFTARDAGVTEFLAKPIAAKSVYLRICSLIRNHRFFIRSKTFTGPDRRRRPLDYGGMERREHVNIY